MVCNKLVCTAIMFRLALANFLSRALIDSTLLLSTGEQIPKVQELKKSLIPLAKLKDYKLICVMCIICVLFSHVSVII